MRVCTWCETVAIPDDADPRRIYCSNACKQKAYRGRLLVQLSLVERFRIYAKTSPEAADFLALLESEQ